jgi:leucyl/phenylalanyl-tRNA--protein transferase
MRAATLDVRMPIYLLNDALQFPPPEGASEEGVVAVGGDARPERLVLAYSQGIFPWPHGDLPLLWFSPDPRFVLELDQVHLARSLRKRIRAEPYEVRFDTDFDGVIRACAAAPRPGQDGTWITEELVQGYSTLARRGLAHSVEAYRGGELVGGLYGIALGTAFCGESMFARADDASKIATVTLLGHLAHWGFRFLDCQVYTDHLARFGAREWRRTRYLSALRRAVGEPGRPGPWRAELTPLQCLELLSKNAP